MKVYQVIMKKIMELFDNKSLYISFMPTEKNNYTNYSLIEFLRNKNSPTCTSSKPSPLKYHLRSAVRQYFYQEIRINTYRHIKYDIQ